ncbi:MAG: hypothetical protein ACXWUL_04595 [Caldimonas sp.]
MGNVAQVLRTMGPEQLFLALVFLACYSLAIGEFAGARARLAAIATAVCAAAGFAAFSSPWEAGVVLLGFGFVGVAVFSALAWALWAAMSAGGPRTAAQGVAAKLPRVVARFSSRSRNTVPILNSPGAE